MGFMLDRGAERCDPAILQPAEPFLDLVGEAVRSRLFLSDGGDGTTMCLRPEFTVPAAREYLASDGTPKRYALAGTVFARGARRPEAPQAGMEFLGHEDRPAADGQALADAWSVVRSLGADTVRVRVGDRAIFSAVASSLGISPPWTRRLTRLFGNAEAIERVLAGADVHEIDAGTDDATALGADPTPPQPLLEALEREDIATLECLIEGRIAATRMRAGARRAREIAARMIEHRDLGVLRMGDRERNVLRSFFAIDAPFASVSDAVRGLDLAGEAIDHALTAHDRRERTLRDLGIDTTAIAFSGSFGRPLDYYTGLVFEIASVDGEVLAAGGRYDRLLSMLGSAKPVPAVGFAVWLDGLGDAA